MFNIGDRVRIKGSQVDEYVTDTKELWVEGLCQSRQFIKTSGDWVGAGFYESSANVPYITKQEVVYTKHYNPLYGDDRICECGHPYYRHFDTYENMSAVGCKYCDCYEFKEAQCST